MSQKLIHHRINCAKCKAERDAKGEESKGDLFHIRIIPGKDEKLLELTYSNCGDVKIFWAWFWKRCTIYLMKVK